MGGTQSQLTIVASPTVHPNHIPQCTTVPSCKCFVPLNTLTNTYFAPTWIYKHALTTNPTSPTPYATFLTVGPADPKLGLATHCPHHRYTTRLKLKYAAVTNPIHVNSAFL